MHIQPTDQKIITNLSEPKLTYKLWTISLSQWRIAKERGILLVDITAKSGVKSFAPDFNVVMQYKRGEVTEEEYTSIYLERMKKSLALYPDKWEMLKIHPEVAFACYCRAGVFCHRHLFITLAGKYLLDSNPTTDVIVCGEIRPDVIEEKQYETA